MRDRTGLQLNGVRGWAARVTRRHSVLLAGAIAALPFLLLVNAVSGWALFTHAKVDPLAHADAIVVLSGDPDGREAYGLELAEQGYAPNVLISKTDRPNDKALAAACRSRTDIRVVCHSATPFTTRGEAIMARQMAEQNGWKKVVVITARFHVPRARRIFEQCFADSMHGVVIRDVPRDYRFSVAEWQYAYFYQYVGWVKAELQGPCD